MCAVADKCHAADGPAIEQRRFVGVVTTLCPNSSIMCFRKGKALDQTLSLTGMAVPLCRNRERPSRDIVRLRCRVRKESESLDSRN